MNVELCVVMAALPSFGAVSNPAPRTLYRQRQDGAGSPPSPSPVTGYPAISVIPAGKLK
jgi:hypothetical protein